MDLVERILNEDSSRHSGTQLPLAWIREPLSFKKQAYSMIKSGHVGPTDAHRIRLTPGQFYRVFNHLKSAGLLRQEAPSTTLIDHINRQNSIYKDLPFAPAGPLYQPPNGGNRILPSLYTQIKGTWLRGGGQPVLPENMNDGHLENTVALLKESHRNVLGKADHHLGAIARHYGNVPEIVEACKTLSGMLHEVDIEEQYPIFGELTAEIVGRQRAKEKLEEQFEMFEDTDFLKEW